MCPRRALIFANGMLPNPNAARSMIGTDDVLFGADGGSRHLLSMGLTPEIVIGDLDSLEEGEKQALETAGSQLIIHQEDKDETDLELALGLAIARGCEPIVIAGALGGRLDQTIGNLSLLTAPDLLEHDIRLDDGVEAAFFIRDRATILGTAGDIVSLIPWGGPVSGVSTTGLRWRLRGETLHPHRTRGISNKMMTATAGVTIDSGLLLIVHQRNKT